MKRFIFLILVLLFITTFASAQVKFLIEPNTSIPMGADKDKHQTAYGASFTFLNNSDVLEYGWQAIAFSTWKTKNTEYAALAISSQLSLRYRFEMDLVSPFVGLEFGGGVLTIREPARLNRDRSFFSFAPVLGGRILPNADTEFFVTIRYNSMFFRALEGFGKKSDEPFQNLTVSVGYAVGL
jgi:hypothetical protein